MIEPRKVVIFHGMYSWFMIANLVERTMGFISFPMFITKNIYMGETKPTIQSGEPNSRYRLKCQIPCDLPYMFWGMNISQLFEEQGARF